MAKPTACDACGSTRTIITEGKLFCAVCSTQIEQFFEVEEDDDRITFNYTAKINTKRQQAAVLEGVDLEENEREMTTVANETTIFQTRKKRKTDIICGPKIPRTGEQQSFSESYKAILQDNQKHPRHEHMGVVSCRLGTFSKALHKLSSMMQVELGFPETYPKQCLCVFQRYLSACGAAFVSNEYTEDGDKMFRRAFVKVKSKSELKDVKKRRKLAKKKKGMNRLEKSHDAWSVLLDKNMTENFELHSEDEEEENLADQFSATTLQVFDSKLHKRVKHAGEKCYLDLDLIVAVLYVAAVSLGCGWVQLSDIVRWIREDRGRIFGEMAFAFSSVKRGLASYVADLTMPLFEFMRVTLWLWQSVDVDTSRLTVDFEQLVARALYNLNLPTDLMERVLFLAEVAPLSQKLDSTYLTQQGDVKEGITCRNLHHSRHLSQCFGRFGNKNTLQSGEMNSDVFITAETKILAYVLLALKLVYGLDDNREHTTPNGSFNVIRWMYQLRMRVLIWDGHDIRDVLCPSKPVYPMKNHHFVKDADHVAWRKGRLELRQMSRIGDGFSGCVPANTNRDSAFEIPNVFQEELRVKGINRNDEDLVYAVLRGQAAVANAYLSKQRTLEEKEKLEKRISSEALKILKEDYSERDVVGPEESTVPTKKFGPVVQSRQRCQSQEQSTRWSELFPSAKNYIKYPRPHWAQGMVIYGKESNEQLRKANKKMMRDRRMLAGLRNLFLSYKGISDLHTAAAPAWSRTFKELVEMFSKSIGEHSYLLYAAFTMLEFQVIRQADYNYTCERLIEGSTVCLSYTLQRNHTKEGVEPVFKHGSVRVSSEFKINEPRQLRWLSFGVPTDWTTNVYEENVSDDSGSEFDDTSSSSGSALSEFEPLSESEDSERVPVEESPSEDDALLAKAENKINREAIGKNHKAIFYSRLYGWDTFWQLLIMRYW